MSIPRDVQEFLDGYPGARDDPLAVANIQFYRCQRRCRPDNMLIDEIHDQWLGDYDTLEFKHGFIQWLFPIQEHGMNYESQPLQLHEIESMKSDPEVIQRIVLSYELMLDFYGMRLVSQETGSIARSLPPRQYSNRYRNLVRSSHNYLRISRILKCLSEMGLERFNLGFLLHILNEQSEFKELDAPGLRNSMDRWWANCVRNAEDRTWIASEIGKVRNSENDVFTREKYEAALERRLQKGSFEEFFEDTES